MSRATMLNNAIKSSRTSHDFCEALFSFICFVAVAHWTMVLATIKHDFGSY